MKRFGFLICLHFLISRPSLDLLLCLKTTAISHDSREVRIRENRLDDADDAYLRHMAVIHIVPASS